MQKKENDSGQFVFDPPQFLTSSQVKSYFSRLTRQQRLHGSQTPLSTSIAVEDDEENQEAENEFDAVLSQLHDESIRSIAEDCFRSYQND